MEQTRGPTNRNCIGGQATRTSALRGTKSKGFKRNLVHAAVVRGKMAFLPGEIWRLAGNG